DWTFWELYFGDGTTEGATSKTGSNKITALTELKIQLKHTLKAGSSNWDLSWGGGYLTEVIQIAGGGSHTLALLANGTVMSWGFNGDGQLGDGTSIERLLPVLVSGLSGVTAVAAGISHSLALLSNGTVKSWGRNNKGQLGNGTTNSRNIADTIPGLFNVTAIAAGETHSLALLSNGTVKSWGYNGYGQLGDGTFQDRWSPVQVSGLTGATAIAAGYSHSLALVNNNTPLDFSDDSVFSWGAGYHGDGTNENRAVAKVVPGLLGVRAVSGGYGCSLALMWDGTVKSWGKDVFSYEPANLTPVAVAGLANVISISAGIQGSLALLSNGTVRAWDGGGTASTEPVSGLSNVTAISAGNAFSLALSSDGSVLGWGRNWYGQLGTGSLGYGALSHVLAPFTETVALTDISKIVASDWYNLALKSDGSYVYAWGSNSSGQLGDGTTAYALTPVRVLNEDASGYLSDVVDISAGFASSYALLADGTVRSWGQNNCGQLGDGTTNTRLLPVAVSGLSGVIAIAAGDSHVLALLENGTVKSWGYNGGGQLGDGSQNYRLLPDIVPGLSGVTAIAAHDLRSLALLTDKTVRKWGWTTGDIMEGNLSYNLNPIAVNGLSDVTAIAIGYALLEDGTIMTFEAGDAAAVAIDYVPDVILMKAGGTSLSLVSSETVNNLGLKNVSSISNGQIHSLALLADGTIKSWGNNVLGQLGNGSTESSASPVNVSILSVSPFIVEGSFDAEYSTVLYNSSYGLRQLIVTKIADVQYNKLVLRFNLEDYVLEKGTKPPTLDELDEMAQKVTVLKEKQKPNVDVKEAQKEFEEEMKRREEEWKRHENGTSPYGPRPAWLDPRIPSDIYLNPPNLNQLVANVRVSEGQVFVLDRSGDMSFLGQGESVRVNFRRPVPNPAEDMGKAGQFVRKNSSFEARPENFEIHRAELKDPGRDVFVKSPGGQWRPAVAGDILMPGDELKTISGSTVKVLLQGGAVGQVEVSEGSFLRITKAGTDVATGDKTTLLDLAMGKVLVHAEKLKGDSKFEVRTPTALTGVRGTTFTVEVNEREIGA
ncbi:MAG TPA: FecR domain-containing protein, partial [Candidatus Omnitrophota bacterium]|nr:FecR domain-containing protein [Candidatus Omnitrophota bacterium]HPS37320.1 FecR domain-containing protein [Candidatus Omnitrophota bacterium]